MRACLALFTLLLLPLAAAGAVSGRDLVTGKTVTVAPGKAGTVVVFLSAKCPCSGSHLPILRNLAREFPDFSFVAVHSNSDEPEETAGPFFRAAGLPFPVIQDEKLKLADELRAHKTPHAFVLGPEGKVLYRGGATNSAEAAKATRFYLKDALTDLHAGRPVKVAEGRTLGCVIAR